MSEYPVAGTPVAEWTEKTLAALNQPTAQTGGYVEAFSPVGTSTSSSILPTTTPAPAHASAPIGDFATGVDPTHASGSIPSKASFAAGVGPEHASGDIPSKATYADPSTFGLVTGGGLATSPNVQAIAAQARAPPSQAEGFTRAELAANKVAAARGEDLSVLSGREQAAAQLAQLKLSQEQTGPSFAIGGSAPASSAQQQQHGGILGGGVPLRSGAAETPGLEVPGGWGNNKVAPPESTLYADVTQALHGVGTAAFSVLPKGVVNSLSTEKGPASTTGTTTGGGLGGFLNSVKSAVSEITQDVKSEFAAPRTGTYSNTSPATLRTAPASGTGSSTTGPDLLKQAQTIFLEGVHKVEALAGNAHANVVHGANTAGQTIASTAAVATEQVSKATGISDPLASETANTSSAVPSTSTAVAPATSLPTDEFGGAKPGEHSDGVGALPGTSAETGVAILPEERRVGADITMLPSSEIKGNRQGDHFDGVGALPGGTADTGVAILPDERAQSSIPEPSPAVEQSRSIPEPSPAFESSSIAKPTSSTSGPTSDLAPGSSASATSSGSYGLAPALGAFREATPLAAPDLSKETHIPTEIGTAIAAKPIASIPVTELGGSAANKSLLPETTRQDSFTSTTAVLHGVAGDRETSKVPIPQSSLRQVSEASSAEKPLPQAPAAGFSSFETDHKVPGSEHGAVGSTKAPVIESDASTASPVAQTSPVTHSATASSPLATSTTASSPIAQSPSPVSGSSSQAPTTPISGATHSDAAVSGHHRTESGGSTGKKSGFLSKIKAKLHHEK